MTVRTCDSPSRSPAQASRRTSLSRSLWLLFPVLYGLLAAAPLWGPGIVATRGGGDSPFLLQRTLDMADSLRAGVFPVRWMTHAAYDLGYPFYNYYAALPYYLSGALTTLGVNILSAIQATQTLGFILASVAAGLWARRLFRTPAARMLTVIAYTFAPFHLVNVYVRGDSLSEFYAFVWFPVILWALERLAARSTWPRVLTAACAYGALILTHNVSALIFSPFALAYALTMVARPAAGSAGSLSRWAGAIAPFVLGLALTAWFWIPAIAETGYGQMGAEFTAGYFHYSQHFRGLTLVQPSPAFDYGVAETVEAGGPFTMGLIQAVTTLVGTLVTMISVYRLRRAGDATATRRKAQQTLVVGSLLLTTFMITPASKPLWDLLPLLALVQFPWRFLSIQALFAAAATGALVETQSLTERPVARWLVTAPIAALLILAALLSLRPERLMIAPEDVTWKNLTFYEAFTANIGTTIRYEYLPEDVVPRLYISEAVVDGQGSLITATGQPVESSLVERTPTSQTWTVRQQNRTAPVAFPLNWWPGWQSLVDGAPATCYPMVGSGRLTVDLAPGDHTVVLRLRPTTLQRVAGLASLVTVIGILASMTQVRVSKLNQRRLLREAAVAGTMLLAALVGPALLQRTPMGHATFFDFIELPFPHRGPIDFGPVKLLGAQLSAETASPGDALTVALNWNGVPAEPLTATLRLVSPATPRHGVDIAMVEASAAIAASVPIMLQLPDDLTRGLYLVELTLAGPHGALNPSTLQGRGMGTLHIGAVRVPEGPALALDATPIAAFEELHLLQVEADQPRATELRLRMHWSTPGTPRNWSLSLRILDLDGLQILQRDLQPAYGYLPTTLWHPNERIVDTVVLPLPEGLAPGDYTLKVITYLEATMHSGGEVEIPLHLTTPTLSNIRDACCELTRRGATILCRTDELALLGLDIVTAIHEGEDLAFTTEWNALTAPTEDMRAAWTLREGSGDTVSTSEAPLAAGSRTSEWPRYTWVLSPQRLDLPQRLDAGALELHLTLQGSASGATVCGRVATIAVLPRPRVFAVPTPSHVQNASFGDALVLLGYDLDVAQPATRLSLTLWWQAQQAPTKDYKRFVHLYSPEADVIAAQSDAMPRDWSYPTTLWVAGEVVSETVTLNLDGVAPGAYRLGLGWYDPATAARLSVTAADLDTVKSDRLTLDTTVTTGR